MTTITKTSASAITRKLSELGFQKYEYPSQLGFDVMDTSNGIHVVNHTVSGYKGTAALELELQGYVIEGHQYLDWSQFLGKSVETFYVRGRIGA
jgi:hypothetical protein